MLRLPEKKRPTKYRAPPGASEFHVPFQKIIFNFRRVSPHFYKPKEKADRERYCICAGVRFKIFRFRILDLKKDRADRSGRAV
jgi:hypothetical protein